MGLTVDLDLLRQVDIVVGLMLALGGALLSAIVWYDRRGRSYVDGRVATVDAGRAETHRRLDVLERRIEEVDGDVEQTIRRLGVIEAHIAALATREQVADLRERMGHMEGSVQRIGGQLDTLYRAAMRSGDAS